MGKKSHTMENKISHELTDFTGGRFEKADVANDGL
jgi:hypothetical protein